MLIFVLQTIWLYIKELAGKDLDVIVIVKFLVYFSPKLIPLVLPLTILLSSIMVFGNFAENYEFAAMKSTGISLQRAMAGLSVFIVILGITTFFFSNNVIPWGEYHYYNLRKNIATVKPAMIIAEGQFNDIGNINIKVAKKTGDRGQFLEDVVIHEKTGRGIGNYRTIISKSGELNGEEKSGVLQLKLFDGYFYDDTPPKDFKDRERHPASKSSFEKYTINVDLSNFNNQDLEEKNITDTYKMLNVSDLKYTIDSLSVDIKKDVAELSSSIYTRTNISQLNTGVSIKNDTIYDGAIFDLFNTKKKVQITELALNTVTSTKQILKTKKTFAKYKNILLQRHIIALHEKFALGFACIILFFVGAPLGALIRKGGIGLPMVIAILLFLTYHFIGIFATNSAKNGNVNPILAAWFSTIIMLPLGYFLTRRATADRGLFEFDHIIEPVKGMFRPKGKINEVSERQSVQSSRPIAKYKNTFSDVIQLQNISYEDLATPLHHAMEILNINHIQLHRKKTEPLHFIMSFDQQITLETRTNLVQNLKDNLDANVEINTSDLENNTLQKSNFNYFIDFIINEDALENKDNIKLKHSDKLQFENYSIDYNTYAKFALIFYCLAIILSILYLVFRNNKLQALTDASLELIAISGGLYLVYFIVSQFNFTKLYSVVNESMRSKNLIFLILSVLFYPFAYVLRKNKIAEDFIGILK